MTVNATAELRSGLLNQLLLHLLGERVVVPSPEVGMVGARDVVKAMQGVGE